MRRREFIAALGGAGTWPLAARAQQLAMPVVGFLRGGTLTDVGNRVPVFHQGLKEAGFVEGQNVAIDYRFKENANSLAALESRDLVQMCQVFALQHVSSV
jgi:putative ABC transport system substrate-binding protein